MEQALMEPVFHADWFSENIPTIEKYLSHLKGKEYCQALEIGSWEGRSAIWFLQNILTSDTSTLICVDSFQGNPENELVGYEKDVRSIFESNLRAVGVWHRTYQYFIRSCEALKGLRSNSLDFVYVDGSHDPKDVLVDVVLSWNLLKSGGIMIMDDYLQRTETGSEPKIAIDAFYYVFKKDIIVLHVGYQIIWRKI